MSFGDPEGRIHKWARGKEHSKPIIQRSLELGINFFDTANVYSLGRSEEILGRAIKDFARRDEVVIATKVHGVMRSGPNGGGLSRKALYIGVSAMWVRQFQKAQHIAERHGWTTFVSMQTLYNLVYREEKREMVPL